MRSAEITQLYEDQLTAGYRAYRVIFHTVEKEAAVEEALSESVTEGARVLGGGRLGRLAA